MKKPDSFKDFCAKALAAEAEVLEAQRKKGVTRWGRFFGWGFLALFVGMGVGAGMEESTGNPAWKLAGGLPMLWLFFGFLYLGLVGAWRWRKFNEAYALGPGLKALRELFPGAALDSSGEGLKDIRASGMFARLEGFRAEIAYQIEIDGRPLRLMAGTCNTAASSSKNRPRGTLFEFTLKDPWKGSFSARSKHAFLRKLEGLVGTEILPDRIHGQRFRRTTWPDHEPFDTGHAAFDAHFHGIRGKQGPQQEPSKALLEGLLKVAEESQGEVAFGVSGDKAALVVSRHALFWPEDRIYSETLSTDVIAEHYHRDAELALAFTRLPGLAIRKS